MIKLSATIGGFVAGYFLVKKWLGEIADILKPLVEEVEQMALDGKIDKAERKKLVLDGVALLQKSGKIKLSLIARLALPFVVNWVAQKLPDFTVSQEAQSVLKTLAEKGPKNQ